MNTHPLLLAALLGFAAITSASAATVYWDSNADTPGAGVAPAGAWDASPFWSPDFDGLAAGTANWVPGDTAVFSAGTDATDAFTVSGNATASGIVVEEGALTISGTIALGTGTVHVGAGASLTTNSSLRISTAVGSVYTLDGGKLETTNTGNAGSFIDTDSTIFLAGGGGTIAYSGTVLNIINFTGANPAGTTISGPGALTKAGTGVIAVATACSYGGATIINEGELRIRTTPNRLPFTTPVTVTNPGILNLNGVSQQIGSLTGNGSVGLANATLTVGDGSDFAFDGVIKDTANAGAGGSAATGGKLAKVGTGTMTINGLNAHTGLTTLFEGGLTVASGASLSAATANLTVDGGILNLNNAAQTIKGLAGIGGTIHLSAGHVLTSDPVSSTTCASTISGPGGLTRLNADATNRTLTLTGANTYDGITTVAKGIIAVGSATALGSTTGDTDVQATGGEILFTGATTNFTVAEPFRIAGTGSTDNGALAVIAGANPTLTGAITLTGDATVTVSSSASAGFTSFAAPGNHTLTLAGGNNAAGFKVITGALDLGTGGLIKTQGGKWTLNGTSPYSGPTTISAGILQVDGALTASPVSVNTGGTLGGSGTLGAAATVASGGTVAPGASAGTLSFGSTLTFDAGSFYEAEITGAAASDKVNVAGVLAANGTIKVVLAGYSPVGGETYDLADAASITGVPVFDFSAAALGVGLTWDTSQFLTSGTIKVSGAGDPYSAWAAASGVTGGRNDDDDKDGASNLLEFATNSHPLTNSAGPRVYGKLHPLGGDQVLTLTIAARSGAVFSGPVRQTATRDTVVYTVEGSDDLAVWNTVVISELNAVDSAAVQAALGLPALDVGWEWHTFRTDGGTSTDPGDFARLAVGTDP
ncbi:MAG: autotransporter-associated beta strand repeat-containing protein [Verrucomicrobiales bacterium]|nr:autotransporter-associated beta strand repeat-containing protein [Verrucomicrobiales bacterium]